MTHETITPHRVSPIGYKRAFFTALSRYLKAQRDYKVLCALPDHLLRDVGITRGDIYRAQRRSVRWYMTH